MKKLLALWLAVLLTGIFPAAAPSAYAGVTPGKSTSRSIGAANKKLANQYRSTLLKRFLTYVTYNSQSKEDVPITPDQIETAKKLYAEIQQMGYDVTLSEHYYIFVDIPSNLPWKTPTLGFSSHYDVTPDVKADNVQAQVFQKYDGKPIVLKNNHVIDPNSEKDAYLKTQIGNTVVTSDGTTNLGADDKAGLAIMMTLLETLAKNPNKKHGHIQLIIAPNEDVGRAAEYVEETPYRPDIAFDFDGGVDGEVMVENFNARQVIYTVQGRPGHQSAAATNGYLNAWTPACELGAAICTEDLLPNKSTGREGYAELHHMYYDAGNVSAAKLDIRLRGYNAKEMDRWEYTSDSIANKVAEKFKVAIARRTINNYSNVAECAHPMTMQVTQRAFEAAGVNLNATSVRAGTTAAMFVTKGLVGAYTIFTGQNNPHAYTEWLSEDDMFKSYLVALNIIDQVAQLRSK